MSSRPRTFTRESAERLGWQFTHAEPSGLADIGGGLYLHQEGLYGAELAIGAQLVRRSAKSEDELVEAIRLFESGETDRGLRPNPQIIDGPKTA